MTCISALANNIYALIAKIFEEPIQLTPYVEREPLSSSFHAQKVLDYDSARRLPARELEHTPFSNRLVKTPFSNLEPYLPVASDYQNEFDWFEYLVGLFNFDAERNWAPLGRFFWRNRQQPSSILNQLELKNDVLPERLAKVSKAFGLNASAGKLTEFLKTKARYEEFVAKVAGQRW